MKALVIDSESDNLWQEATLIHVLSYHNGHELKSTDSYYDMKKVLEDSDKIIGHNVIGHDMKVFEKILGMPANYKNYVDTLGLSRYLFPDRASHSLDSWGDTLGIKKPKIDDWKTGTYEDYKHRCEEDVKINLALWSKKLFPRLKLLYPEEKDRERIIQYINFKMDCMVEQEDIGWKINLSAAKLLVEDLENKQKEKVEALKKVMPYVTKYKTLTMPKTLYKKDKTISVAGQKWLDALEANGLPKDHTEPLEVVKGAEEPNPNSPDQLKEWLTSLGWKPITFKFVRERVTRAERKIPQIKKRGELCPSVERLADKVDEVNLLKDLSVIQHRIGVVNSIIKLQKDGWVEAGSAGFTNTMRFRHNSPCVNIPGVDKPWGKEIRSLFIAPSPAHKLCGADMASLEATTKAHYIYPYDKEYALELTDEDFDEHLDLARQNGAVSQDDYSFYTNHSLEGDARWDKLHKVRKEYKPVNYSAIYGIGKDKLARENDFTVSKASELLTAYWERNKAVSELVKDLTVKTVGGIDWLFNPVSRFWYQLKFDKDRFSTLNQGTGAFLFDCWVARVRDKGIRVCAQFHDEIVFWTLDESYSRACLEKAIAEVNEAVDLNVTMRIDIKFGDNYAEVH